MTIVEFPKFTVKARELWNKIPPFLRDQILHAVWCSQCRKGVLMDLKNGEMSGDTLVLGGTCRNCGHRVVRVIEPEDD